ncbi:MAG TPA: hypothetical protein VIJ04_08120 [Xanthobacteraceae bacterium]
MTAPKRLRSVNDRRSTWARRHRDLAAAFTADLGAELSAADRAFVDHAATVAVECERMKTRQLNGEAIDLDELVRLSNALTRVRKELGTHAASSKGKKELSLDEYLAGEE